MEIKTAQRWKSSEKKGLRTMLAFFLAATFAIVALVAKAESPAALGLRVVQPEYLSLQAGAAITIQVTSESARRVPASLILRNADGTVEISAGSTYLDLTPGLNEVALAVEPGALTSFSPGEDLRLTAWVDGRSDSIETTALYSAKAPEASPWAMAFASSPVILGTGEDQHVLLNITNPKKKEKQAQITLSFLDASGKTVATASENESLNPGTHVVPVGVNISAALAAKAGNATRISAALKVGPAIKASAIGAVSFNGGGGSGLTASASGTPVSGSAPLTVSFTGSASGGMPPYSYDWNFGDGSAHGTGQNASHTYAAAGSYSASLTVTDGTAAKATSSPVPVSAGGGGGGPSLSAIQSSLFTPRCTMCHSGSGAPMGMSLEAGKTYSNTVNVPSHSDPNMMRVKPGDPANSYIIVQLGGGHQNVSTADQQAIKDWISAGAPNN